MCDLLFQDGLLWTAMDGAVIVWDVEDRIYLKYTILDGLAGNNVYAVAAVPDGRLCFGTYYGVSCYDPQRGTWQTFTTADGLVDEVV